MPIVNLVTLVDVEFLFYDGSYRKPFEKLVIRKRSCTFWQGNWITKAEWHFSRLSQFKLTFLVLRGITFITNYGHLIQWIRHKIIKIIFGQMNKIFMLAYRWIFRKQNKHSKSPLLPLYNSNELAIQADMIVPTNKSSVDLFQLNLSVFISCKKNVLVDFPRWCTFCNGACFTVVCLLLLLLH